MKTEPNDIIHAFEETDTRGDHYRTHPGLTKREYFAGLVLQGLAANPNPGSLQRACEMSVEAADWLIEELNKIKP